MSNIFRGNNSMSFDNDINPLVSVIMPAYNGEKFIQEAVDSILNQTYQNLELIIVEDASTDRTREILETIYDPRIRIFYNEKNRGISYSSNLATKYSKGKYIALLDDDDVATLNRLELQVDYMEKHLEIDVLGGRSLRINENGDFISYLHEPIRNPKLIRANLLFYNYKFANGTIMYRKEFVIRNNIEYEEKCFGMQDFKFAMDCSRYGSITAIDNLLHYKRVHSNEETVRQLNIHAEERRATYSRFQRENIEKSGFKLSDEDYDELIHCLYSVRLDEYTEDDMKKMFGIFCKMIEQGKLMQIDYLDELEFACKKILGERMLTRCDIFKDRKNA